MSNDKKPRNTGGETIMREQKVKCARIRCKREYFILEGQEKFECVECGAKEFTPIA